MRIALFNHCISGPSYPAHVTGPPWISLSFKMIYIFLLSFSLGLKKLVLWAISLQIVTGQAAGGWLTLATRFSGYFVAFGLIGIQWVCQTSLDKAIKQAISQVSDAYLGYSAW